MPGESDMDCQTDKMGPCPEIPGYVQRRRSQLYLSSLISFFSANRGDGYRRCTYMMIDKEVAYASPSKVYRVLKKAEILKKKDYDSSKRKGFKILWSPMNTGIRIFHMLKFNIAFTFLSVC